MCAYGACRERIAAPPGRTYSRRFTKRFDKLYEDAEPPHEPTERGYRRLDLSLVHRPTPPCLRGPAPPRIPTRSSRARLGFDPKTILDTYAHLLSTSDEAAADVIAEALV